MEMAARCLNVPYPPAVRTHISIFTPRSLSPVLPHRNPSAKAPRQLLPPAAAPPSLPRQIRSDATVSSTDLTEDINSDEKIPQDDDQAFNSRTGLDSDKMVRVCDKLLEVFMVDKPTTTDWRRLLAFSKEWSNIRPHFYKRCSERADVESEPGMKHKLLRLGRKLKEIDDDLQRHDELIQAIREAPSEISSIVAKRRNDFTKEFFVASTHCSRILL